MRDDISERTRIIARTLAGQPDDWRLRRPPRLRMPMFGSHWIGPAMAIGSTLVGWLAFSGAIGRGNTAFALFIGSVSIMLMAWSNLLSTRAAALEQLFGGLDRMYRWHRWFGALAVVAMWLHTQTARDVKGIAGASRDVAKAAQSLASTGTNIIYALVGVSLLRWLPSRWWRLSHKLLGIPFVFACWHFYTATKPYANDTFWGWWFTGFMILGTLAWLHRVVWRDMIRRGRDHRVSRCDRTGDTLTIELTPLGRPMRHELGQFAFLKVRRRGLSEPHPFTIASAPDDPALRFVIRDLGDWSGRIGHALEVGDRVTVEGPYGRLEPLPSSPERRVLWIAGGVGITPFLGAATSRQPGTGPRPVLIYCVRSRDTAPGIDIVERAAAEGRIDLRLFVSAEGCRVSAADIADIAGARGLADTHVVMCGPTDLVREMRSAVADHGARDVHVEGFDIRTGIGPDMSRQVDALLARWFPSLAVPAEGDLRNDETPAAAGVRSGAKGN